MTVFDVLASNRNKGVGLSNGSGQVTVTLPTGVDAASTVMLAVAVLSANTVPGQAAWTTLTAASTGNVRIARLQRSSVNGLTGGDSSWTLTGFTVSSLVAWIVWEQPGVDPAWEMSQDYDATVTNTTSGTSAAASTPAAGTTGYDEGLFATFAQRETGATPASFTGYTADWAEVDQVSGTDGTNSITLAVAARAVQQPAVYSCSATTSQTLTATDSAAGTINGAFAKGSRVAPDVIYIEAAEQLTLAHTAPSGSSDTLIGTVVGNVVASSAGARSGGGGIVVTAAGAAANFQTPALAQAGFWAPFTRHFEIVGSLPGSRVRLWTIPPSAGNATVAVDIRSDGKLGVTVGTGTEQVSDAVVTADQWFGVDLLLDGRALSVKADWQVRYNAETSGGSGSAAGVAQTQASFGASATTTWGLAQTVGPTSAATITFRTADAFAGRLPQHYPVGDLRTKLLLLDAAATPTVNGTVGNFAHITNNATGSTLTTGAPLATARDNLREGPPPDIGSGQDGICQITAASGDYIDFPFEDADWAALGLVPRGVSLVAVGWGASTTAANIGLSLYDGTTDYPGIGAFSTGALDLGFSNSTTAPVTVRRVIQTSLGNRIGWTPAQVNALKARIGRSSDATPDKGFLWVGLIVACSPVSNRTLFGGLASMQADPETEGIQQVTVTPPSGYDTTLHYEEAGTPTDVPVTGGATVTEVIQAPDAPTVNYIAAYPAAEPAPGA